MNCGAPKEPYYGVSEKVLHLVHPYTAQVNNGVPKTSSSLVGRGSKLRIFDGERKFITVYRYTHLLYSSFLTFFLVL
jgi:hypothetical protein